MSKLKAITSLFLIVMLTAMLAACGGSKSETASTETASASTPPSTAPASTAAASESAPERAIDLGGDTIKIAAWWDLTPKADSESGELLVKKLQEVQEKYNVKIEFVNVPWDQYKEKFITSTTAGQPFADIIKVDAGWFPGFAQQGLLVPFDELVDRSSLAENDYNPMFDKIGAFGGTQYGWDGSKAETGTGIFYNKTLLEKLGMKDLNDYVKEDNWNWDTFAQAAKDATRDTNGDGKVDTWGLTAYHADFLNMLVGSIGGNMFDDVNMKEGISDPTTVQALEFLQKLYHGDKVVRFKNPGDWAEQRKLFPEGNVLMVPGYIWEINDRAKDMGDNKWSYVPFPKAPGATDYVSNYPGLNFNVVPKGTKHPKEAMQILFELNDITPSTEEEYLGQTWYESVVTDEAALENLKLTATKTQMSWVNAITDYPVWTVADEVVKGASVSSTVEKYKTVAQAKIDETFKK